MVEHSVSQLPPQSPDDYPYLSNAARAPAGGAHCSKTFSPSDSGLVQPGPSVSGLSAGMNHPGVQVHPGAGHPLAGYPWGAPEPFPYSQASYPQVMMLPPPRAFWDGRESAMRRKRTTNRRLAIAGGIVGVLTSVAQLVFYVILLLDMAGYDIDTSGQLFLITFFGVVAGWQGSFVLALVALVLASSRQPQIQPHGWPEAKRSTSVLLAASSILGTPIGMFFIMVLGGVLLTLSGRDISGYTSLMLWGCTVMSGIILLAYVILLRKMCVLDVTTGASA